MQLAKAVRTASNVALVIAFFNGLGFILASIALGGTFCPSEGGVDEYYLCAGSELTRVSKHVFYYSLWHALSVPASLGIAMLLGGWSQWLWRGRPEARASRSPDEKASALDYVTLVGAVILGTSILGLIVWMAWSRWSDEGPKQPHPQPAARRFQSDGAVSHADPIRLDLGRHRAGIPSETERCRGHTPVSGSRCGEQFDDVPLAAMRATFAEKYPTMRFDESGTSSAFGAGESLDRDVEAEISGEPG